VKICVVGAGAIGGMLAVRLALTGHEVSVVIRGANLAAVRADGMKLIMGGSEQVARVVATDDLSALGPQDLVILGMKAHGVAAVAPGLVALHNTDTVVMTAQNGIPWWYFHKLPGPYEGRRIESVDPGGIIAAHIEADRVIGSIVYPAAELLRPGVIRHVEGNRFSLGELDGADTERVRRVAQALRDAGLKAPIVPDIRSELWVKLWGNCTFNPISALTHATLDEICRFPETHELAVAMMGEAQAIGEAVGVRFAVSLDKRIAGAQAVGAHKTSMLQDVESGRPIELAALLGSVIELGCMVDRPVTHLRAVHALAALLAHTLTSRPGRLAIAGLMPNYALR
jgi:2-dehydropantoate 2-reductase